LAGRRQRLDWAGLEENQLVWQGIASFQALLAFGAD
jgi:hypothetical protein